MGVEIDKKTITIMKPMYLTHAIASTSGARRSDAATSDKDKKICLSTLPRTGLDAEVFSYLAFHS